MEEALEMGSGVGIAFEEIRLGLVSELAYPMADVTPLMSGKRFLNVAPHC